MTAGCGLCHINTKEKKMYSTTEVFTQENTLVTHEGNPNIHIYTSIPSTYAIYTTFN
jgi:hypothetical protein